MCYTSRGIHATQERSSIELGLHSRHSSMTLWRGLPSAHDDYRAGMHQQQIGRSATYMHRFPWRTYQ